MVCSQERYALSVEIRARLGRIQPRLCGNHTFKVGADARINSIVIPSTANTAGTFSFGTSSATALDTCETQK